MKFLALLAVCVGAAMATRSSPTITRTPIRDYTPFGAAVDAKNQPTDMNVALFSAAEGWSFNPADDDTEVPVCLNVCEDGRDCYYFSEGCDGKDCDYCVEVSECVDSVSKRCKRIADCPCAEGNFQCIPSPAGVTFVPQTNGTGTDRFDLLTPNGFPAIVAREQCTDVGFNFEPCRLSKENCEAMEPCVDESGTGCCLLVPYPLPAAWSSTAMPSSVIP